MGFAEHHVIGASLGGEHGIMAAVQTTGAGDAVGLERGERSRQRLDAGQMRAVSAGADGQVRIAVEQKRNVMALNRGRDGFGAVDHRAFVGVLEAKENSGDVAGFQSRANVAGKRGRVAQLRRDQIKLPAGRWNSLDHAAGNLNPLVPAKAGTQFFLPGTKAGFPLSRE